MKANSYNLYIPCSVGGLHKKVRKLGEEVGAEFVEMGTPTSYFELLERLWAKQEAFMLLEQDILPTAELIAELAYCRCEWCSGVFTEPPSWWPVGASSGWEVNGRQVWNPQLGFNKFGAALLRRIPDAVTRVARLIPERYWPCLADAVTVVLSREEACPTHLHLPGVQNLHWDHHGVPRVEGNLESGLRRVETSRLMLEVVRGPLDFVGIDSRTGTRTGVPVFDVLRPHPIDVITAFDLESLPDEEDDEVEE